MVGFMDLSAELRNKVYELALVQATPLRVGATWSNLPPRRDEQEYEALQHPPPALTTNILLVSRTVHAEATAMLYGGNTFCVYAGDLLVFIDTIGADSAKHLRTFRLLGVHHHNEYSLAGAFAGFDMLQNLQSVRIAANHIRAGKLIRIMAPWAKALHAKRGLDPVDILDFDTSGALKRSTRGRFMVPSYQESQLAWVKEVKKLLSNSMSNSKELRKR